MLKEESSVFTVDNDDIGNVTTYEIEIILSDNTPVQQSYNAIPRALDGVVKSYIEDLLNKKIDHFLTAIIFITYSSG